MSNAKYDRLIADNGAIEYECNLCESPNGNNLFKELPFYNCEQICESTDNNEQLNVTYPSRVTDNRFKILKSKGFHFVHLNACSIFHKISELRLIAKEYSPAVISITKTCLKI